MNRDKIILFDGVCNLCNEVVQYIIKVDKRGEFKFGSLQANEAKDLLQPFGIEPSTINSFIYFSKGRPFTRSTAALKVLNDLGGIWKIAVIFFLVPRFIRNMIYDQIAENRYKLFGKRESCMVPTPEIMKRFLW